ncbi:MULTISPECIES: DUF2839 domain-containing protein [unclassified Prochlorococcus]|uniref:DUF2839 domain-containing protein n=1 Tax=unclassified Prochlorococcus TaxID=2627481 RepID=UPI0005337A34|nr:MULTISPECIES: DUF2839 domain-containing protein [unclassified Prochlorococcus]KGG14671.1 hypothetical protein EV06_1731 [Prochlorococcus sp. MIT 0602]KGG15899.1 hypothetical protein EV07_1866 [Prochlorococcus sp. MIT 0603]
MGEARRRAQENLGPRKVKTIKKSKEEESSRIIEWLPITQRQREQFIDLTIKGGWVGIGILVLVWVVVRILGPAAGWWIPADLR